MALASGKYAVRTEREVIVWPAPDVNGDGDVIWVEEYDALNRPVGRHTKKDEHGREVRSYHAPDGFRNFPGYDHTDNYVMVNDRGDIIRQPNGEAVNIKPGQALAIAPDGSVEVLPDEYAQYVFAQLNDVVDEDGAKKTTAKKTK